MIFFREPIFFVFVTIASTVAGQLFMKAGVLKIAALKKSAKPFEFIITALMQIEIITGFALAFIAAISWILAMRTLPLNYAYPFTALSIILVAVASRYIFHEHISLIHWSSLALVIGGLVLLSFAKTT